jgi:hypothetical protein
VSSPRQSFAAHALAVSLGFAVFAGTGLSAAGFDARSLAYIPVHYSAGDEVVVRATILPEAGEKLAVLDLKPGAGLPAQGEEADPEIRELWLSRTPEGWLLSMRFVPWSPGSGFLPETRIKGLHLPALPYASISSLGPDDRDPSPPRPQRAPPGTALYLYCLGGFLIVLAFLTAGVALYLIPSARALLARRRAAQAFKRFGRSLDYLAAETETADPASYFAALIRALRLYLAARGLPEAEALTAAELAALPETAFPAPATKDKAAALVARADRVRYGEGAPGGARSRALLEAAVEEARAIGAANEEALLARV